MRARAGGAQSRAQRNEILPARGAVMERVTTQQLAMMPIEFKLNGQTVVGRPDEKLIETAKKHGVDIPHLCHGGNQRSDGNCRACVVEIKGERALAPSCCRFPTAGMEVTTNSPRALTSQKMVFDLDDAMGESTCVACGECVQACPTGALMPARGVGLKPIEKKVDSVCPFCGVGCLLTYHVAENKIQFVTGNDGPSNHYRLCVKGRFGFDYAHHPHRLTKPLIRKPGVAKSRDFVVDPGNWSQVFREASWEEALEVAAEGLKRIRDKDRYALAGFGSAKGSNEEAYLFQKVVRTGFGTNNVDHCTRLCHASSVAALMEGINSGAVSNQVNDVAKAELVFLIGANPTSNHPVAATWMKNAAKNGVKLIVADPRRNELARHATQFLQFKP